MELDQLKAIWKDVDKASLPMNEADLHQMLNHRSRRPIALMKRNLKLEVFFLILSYCLCIFLISYSADSTYLFYDALMIIVAILFMIYARYKYKVLGNMECMSCEVKTNLYLQINSLEKLVKLYFKAGNVSVPLAYCFAGIISYINTKGETVSFPGIIEVVIFLAIGIILSFFGYYFNRWYLYQLYGKHIQKLKHILYEMEESNSI